MSGLLANWIGTSLDRLILVPVCCCLLIAGGCRERAPEIQNDPVEAAPVEAAAEPEPTPPEPASVPAPAPAPERGPIRIAILISSSQPEYESVRTALAEIAGPANVSFYSLEGKPAGVAGVISEIRDSGLENVVAIGLLAARASRRLTTGKVVFCQVFNYQDHDLLSDTSHGVQTIADVGPAIDVWSGIDKELGTIGLITGPGHEARIEAAQSVLSARGMDLVHRITGTDKETVLEFQRLLPEIDGYWMFPDNRVLSSSAIREMMTLARRSQVGVLANDPRFHQIGALISAAYDPREIAERAYSMLDSARDSAIFSGPEMSPLKNPLITIRAEVAAQLGYSASLIPSEFLAR